MAGTDVAVVKTNVESYRASTEAATLCKEIVVSTAMKIGGRSYVRVEGWQALAVAHGCAAGARDVEKVDGGVRAIGEVRRMSDGAVIAVAEGFVGEDEPTWYGGKLYNKELPKRPDYAIRAMAQTRAISRACRSAFAHVVVMMNAGLQTTPAEEVPLGGFDDEPRNITPEPVKSAHAARKEGKWPEFEARIHKAETVAELKAAENDPWMVEAYKSFPAGWKRQADELCDARREELGNAEAALDVASERVLENA